VAAAASSSRERRSGSRSSVATALTSRLHLQGLSTEVQYHVQVCNTKAFFQKLNLSASRASPYWRYLFVTSLTCKNSTLFLLNSVSLSFYI
jgi:hypothetical protein